MNLFLAGISQQFKQKKICIIMDQAGWHKSKGLAIPSNITIIYLPPYSPELNPIERLWQHMKRHLLKNKIYETLQALEDAVCDFIRSFKKDVLLSICSVNYLYYYL